MLYCIVLHDLKSDECDGLFHHRQSPPYASQAAAGSMGTVNDVFERESARPLYGIARGELTRALLLQIQHLKVLLEEQARTLPHKQYNSIP